jgi:hypothetical protein
MTDPDDTSPGLTTSALTGSSLPSGLDRVGDDWRTWGTNTERWDRHDWRRSDLLTGLPRAYHHPGGLSRLEFDRSTDRLDIAYWTAEHDYANPPQGTPRPSFPPRIAS